VDAHFWSKFGGANATNNTCLSYEGNSKEPRGKAPPIHISNAQVFIDTRSWQEAEEAPSLCGQGYASSHVTH
jgi:hypothetical protein